MHVCNRYYPYFGGVETHVKNVSERMVEKGHEVWVYSTDYSGKLSRVESMNGVKIRRFKAFAPSEVYYFSLDLCFALQKARCDIIHAHDLHGFPFLSVTNAKGSKKRIVTLHVGGSSSFLRDLWRIPYDRVLMHARLKNVNRIICVSQYELKVYPRILGLPYSKFIHIPNGTDLVYVNDMQSTGDSRFILSVGRLEKSKGFHYLIRSFEKLCKDEKFKDVNLVIVGKGPYRSQLIKLAIQMEILDKIKLLEDVPQDHLLMLYRRCNVFSLLSKYESHSVALLDAIALCKPIISTSGGGLDDYVRKGCCVGVKWPPDPDIVADKIKHILENPEKFKPSRIKVLTWNDVTAELLSLYDDVLTNG